MRGSDTRGAARDATHAAELTGRRSEPEARVQKPEARVRSPEAPSPEARGPDTLLFMPLPLDELTKRYQDLVKRSADLRSYL
jgi:hypothetical protein